tara:strand:- start:5152 stop:7143 length:1992 start_codon:yes stop_codon:yes gene_type:complete
MFKRILIANRGEIAVRIARTCKKMGIKTVSIYSDADKDAMHVRESDSSVYIGKSLSEDSYLNIDKIIRVAKKYKVDAIHPGYGFLSENPNFSRKIKKNNLIFIGPSENSMKSMALKTEARKIMQDAGVPVLPGFSVENMSNNKILKACKDIGFPLIIKASAGGGGKGMHVINYENEVIAKVEGTKREALSSFGNEKVLIEKYIENPRHIEVQIMADNFGNVEVLSDRDCSIQRRHQKVIEEAPAPFIKNKIKDEMAYQAVQVAKKIAYSGAGTIEFLYEKDKFYFMEMNTRLQVEHPVTEEILGLDLVKAQIRIAYNERIDKIINKVSIKGHALEVRVYAENPEKDFLPSPGKVLRFSVPNDNFIRLDSGYSDGDAVSSYYDPMIAKIIVYGKNRDDVIKKMSSALNRTKLFGVENNIYFLNNIIKNKNFSKKNINTKFIDANWKDLVAPLNIKEIFRCVAASLYFHYRNQLENKSINSPWGIKTNWRHAGNDIEDILFLDSNEEFHFKCQIIRNCSYKIFSNLNENKFIKIKYLKSENKENILILYDLKKIKFHILMNGNEINLASMGYNFQFIVKEKYSSFLLEDTTLGTFDAPVPGKVVKIFVKLNERVEKGFVIAIIEAMKMEHSIIAPFEGKIVKINVKESQQVEEGFTLVEMDKKDG